MSNVSTIIRKVISDDDRAIIQLVNFLILTNSVCLFGVVTNVMNLIIFYKQGFEHTVNISFFGLAISDLCSLLTLLWYCVCVNPWFANSDVPMATTEIIYLTGGLPHITFARITGWITVYITAERCLCITLPLKIKLIITPKTTTVTLFIIFVVVIASFLPEYGTTYIDWKFFSDRNRSLLGLTFTENRGSVEGLAFIFYSILGSVSFAAVIIFTVVLVVQLKQKSKWRKNASDDKNKAQSISNKERKTVTMVIMITIVLIVCYIPGVAVAMVTFFEPEFSIIGKYVNIFFVMWSFALLSDAVNSSVNIFLYYRMSSKYRETFNQTFGIKGTV